MDATTIELLALSFARVSANKDDAASIFYARLFTTVPQLRATVRTDLELQKRKLMASLAQIVDYSRLGFDPKGYLAELAREQRSSGAQKAHFDAVGDALLFTLAQVLGEDFTPQIRSAWSIAYDEVAANMLRSLESAASHATMAAGRLS